ncbi:MAG TPA: 1-phosphofructokinase family hexose kinase [Daejeonella sp.]|uniref:1-phosphofructokinase family hexose kinase n=1 Tax=Daejeonella sp. TaxID=2805397 RepID=UPI002EDB7C76
MTAIITITFNPAIDKSTTVQELIPEKKLRCTVPVFEPGGGGINVARAIHKLGGHAMAAYLAGGYTGKAFTQLLISEGISSIVSEIGDSTRENLVVFENSSAHQYRFVMPGPLVQTDECMACLNSIKKIPDIGYIVVSGSMPEGVPQDIFALISGISKAKNARLVVDTSGDTLKQAVSSGVYLIKPNLRELSSLAGQEQVDAAQAVDIARGVIMNGTCEVIALSMGEKGAILITRDTAISIVPPRVQIKSTVGAGDSMLAGIVYSLSLGKSLIEAGRYGVACGTAATLNPGTELCRKEDADRLYELITLS